MSQSVSTIHPVARSTRSCWPWFFIIFAAFIFFCGVVLGPVNNGMVQTRHSAWRQQGRQIGQMMFAYATDNVQNGNAYPDGKSSTEVFQNLLDKGYASDPAIFYIPLPGKTRPVAGQKLKPENVCWDVTSGVDSNTSDQVPLIFMTGYRVNYVPGGSAVPLVKPFPAFGTQARTWSEWWNGEPSPLSLHSRPGIAVFYKGNNAAYINFTNESAPIDPIPNFISLDFKPDGKTYRQLTPDGVLP